DPRPVGEGQDLVLDGAVDERVRRLERLDGGDRLDPTQLPDVEVRDSDVADEPLLLQFGEGGPSLLEVGLRVGPVDLVEVDRIDSQPGEAGLDLAPDGIARQAVGDPAAASVQERRLREHVGAVPAAGQGPADNLLRVPEPVDGRRVDPVGPEVERPLDRRQGLIVVLLAPGELVTGTADRPRAEAEARDLETGVAEVRGRKCRLLCHSAGPPESDTKLSVSKTTTGTGVFP